VAVTLLQFAELTRLANGGGAGVGRSQFDPLMVDIAGLSPGLVTLLKDAAIGKHIPSVELVGLRSDGKGELQKVSDLKLNNVTVAGVAADGGHDTAIAFDYTKVTETIKGQHPDGSLDAGQTFSFDLRTNGGGITPVNHDTLEAFAHSHDGGAELTYLLKVDGVAGDSTIKGYEGYFTVDEFTFTELTRLANAGSGAGAGRPQFDPLTVDIVSSDGAEAIMMREARELIKQKNPSLQVDGEVQGIMAFNKEILRDNYPFSDLIDGDVNTLIFPNLSAGNIAYNLLQEVGGADAIGPVLLGLKKPVHVLQLGSSVRSIFNMVLIAVTDAQMKCEEVNTIEAIQKSKWWKRFRKVTHDV